VQKKDFASSMGKEAYIEGEENFVTKRKNAQRKTEDEKKGKKEAGSGCTPKPPPQKERSYVAIGGGNTGKGKENCGKASTT